MHIHSLAQAGFSLTKRVQERLQVDAIEGEGLVPHWVQSMRFGLRLVHSEVSAPKVNRAERVRLPVGVLHS